MARSLLIGARPGLANRPPDGRVSLTGVGLARRGFSLIELMVVLVVIGVLTMFAIWAYSGHIEDARRARAKFDLEELAKAIRLHNIKEEQPFSVATLTGVFLGSFVGTYLEKDPPLDPWRNPYFHDSQLGVVFSRGPDGIYGTPPGEGETCDDIVIRYLPEDFYITRVDYQDGNRNNQVDFGDSLEVFFSRPAKMADVDVFDFSTSQPEKALGSAVIRYQPQGNSLQIIFSPPVEPKINLGKTTLIPRPTRDAVLDYSPSPRRLQNNGGVVIQRSRGL